MHDIHKHGTRASTLPNDKRPQVVRIGQAFQHNAFQNDAFQTGTPDVVLRLRDGTAVRALDVIKTCADWWDAELGRRNQFYRAVGIENDGYWLNIPGAIWRSGHGAAVQQPRLRKIRGGETQPGWVSGARRSRGITMTVDKQIGIFRPGKACRQAHSAPPCPSLPRPPGRTQRHRWAFAPAPRCLPLCVPRHRFAGGFVVAFLQLSY